MQNDPSMNHEYLPIHGSDTYLKLAQSLVFGADLHELVQPRLSSIQATGGTGANHLAALFLGHRLRSENVWIPTPTWNNHNLIWQVAAPSTMQRSYPYYDAESKTFAFDAMMSALIDNAKRNDVLLLHACAHNPTGFDPSESQWEAIRKLCVDLQLFVVFDLAYQGFASGDLDADAWAVRQFASDPNLEMAICQSFSKNFGLYGERVGALHLITADQKSAAPVMSHLVRLQRAEISNPSQFGSRIVASVLADANLFSEWLLNIKTMSSRVLEMRSALYKELVALGTPGDWSHIVQQVGMFSFTGLNPDQVKRLRDEHHVYLMENGRASICGLTTANIRYVATTIHEVVMSSYEKQGGLYCM